MMVISGVIRKIMAQTKLIVYIHLSLPYSQVRPIIKSEVTTGPRGGKGESTTKTTPFYSIQMTNLQDRYGHKPRETETEYLRGVFLPVADRILHLGASLNAGPDPPKVSHSLTGRVAHWAGGIDVLERGKPLLIPIKSLNTLSAAFTRAACIQAMHQCDSTDAPNSAPVTPAMLKPLIKGAPATLKPFLLQER